MLAIEREREKVENRNREKEGNSGFADTMRWM
jgi:hypothetical protein